MRSEVVKLLSLYLGAKYGMKTWIEWVSSRTNLGIISDVHEDIEQLKQALAKLDGCNSIVCLGDLIGYRVDKACYLSSRDAHAVVEMIKDRCEFCVVGNHDLHSGTQDGDPGSPGISRR